jgi:hypothetical protein
MITSTAFKTEEEVSLNSWNDLCKDLTLKDIPRIYPIEEILEISEYQLNRDKELIKSHLCSMSDVEACRFNEVYKYTYPIDLEFIFDILDDRMWEIGRNIYNRIFPNGAKLDEINLKEDRIHIELSSFTEEIVFKGLVGQCLEKCIIGESFGDSYVLNIKYSNPILIESSISKRYKTVLALVINKNTNYYSMTQTINTKYELFRFMTSLGMNYISIDNEKIDRIELFNSIKNNYL